MSNIFAKHSRDSVFKDRYTLTPEFVPDQLPRREAETERLVEALSILLDPYRSVAVNIAITGQAGIGKTTIAKLITKDLENYAIQQKIKLETHYVNCHTFRSKTSILRRLASDKFNIHGRGFSDEELTEKLATRLDREDKRVVLTIDEAGMLKGEDILGLIHMNELFGPGIGRLSIIIISRRQEWSLMLDTYLSGRIQDQLNLSKYSIEDLKEILSYRRNIGFFADVLPDDVLDLIIDISASTGNARHGIEIMLRAGMIANSKGVKQISADFVRAAKHEVYPELRSDVFKDLKFNELAAALSIARKLKSKSGLAMTTINEAFEVFKVVCAEHDVKSPGKATYRICIDNLNRLGIVNAQVKPISDGSRGRRSVITLHDIPASILEDRITEILKNYNVDDYE
jgi:archaeal cell division control protein 6